MRFWIHTRTRAHSAHAVDSVNIESSTTVCGNYSFFFCWCALGDTRLHLHLNVRFQRGCFVVGAEIHTTSFSPLPVTHLFVCVLFVRFVCCAISRMVERLSPVLWKSFTVAPVGTRRTSAPLAPVFMFNSDAVCVALALRCPGNKTALTAFRYLKRFTLDALSIFISTTDGSFDVRRHQLSWRIEPLETFRRVFANIRICRMLKVLKRFQQFSGINR